MERSNAPLDSPAPAPFTPVTEDSVASRLARLEDVVAELCHTEPLEERITENVLERLRRKPERSSLAVDGKDSAAQPAEQVSKPPPVTIAELQLPPLAAPAELPAANLTTVSHSLRANWPLARGVVDRIVPPSSLLRDIWWDFRIGYRMLRDPVYPMTTACKVIPIFALLYVTVWPLFSSWTGIVGTILNGLVYIAVLYVAFKIIHRELHRYYEFAMRYRRL